MSALSLQNQYRELKKTPHIKRYLLYYIFIIIFLFASFSLFWGIGSVFKHNYFAFIKTLNTDENLSIKIIEYKEGWFHSSAKIFIPANEYFLLLNPSAQFINSFPNKSGFVIEQTITHGPIVFDDTQNKYSFVIAGIKSDVFTASTNMTKENAQEIIKINSLALINNQYTNHIQVHSTDLMLYGNSLKWQGLTGDINFVLKNNHINNFVIEINSAPFVVNYQNYLLTVSGITTKNDMTRNSIGLWDGTQSISLPQVTLTINHDKYDINNFDYSSNFIVDQKNNYNYTSQVVIRELSIPEFIINPMQINYSMTGINAKGFHDFLIMSKNINKKNDQERQLLERSFSNLFTSNLKIALEMMSNTNYGKMILHASVDWPENSAPPNDLEAIKNNLRVRLDVSVPTTLINHLFINYFNKTQPQPTPQPILDKKSIDPLQSFEDDIEHLEENDKISVTTKTRLFSILSQQPDLDTFSAYVDQLVALNSISDEMANQLKNEYKTVDEMKSENLANQDNNQQQAQTAPEAATPESMAKERIDAYKNLGYIIQQDENYTTVITFENGQLKVNDKLLSR
jgi:hypothetical protein